MSRKCLVYFCPLKDKKEKKKTGKSRRFCQEKYVGQRHAWPRRLKLSKKKRAVESSIIADVIGIKFSAKLARAAPVQPAGPAVHSWAACGPPPCRCTSGRWRRDAGWRRGRSGFSGLVRSWGGLTRPTSIGHAPHRVATPLWAAAGMLANE